MWIIPLIVIIPVIYLLVKKPSNESHKKEGKEGDLSPPPLPSLSNIQRISGQESKETLSILPGMSGESEPKKKYKSVSIYGIPIEYQSLAKLFLFSHKVGLLQNQAIFERIASYMTICQDFDIKKKELKFYPAPLKKINIAKCEEYFKRFSSKYHTVGIYRDSKEADFLCNEFIIYLNDRVDIIEDSKTFYQPGKIEHIITDNISLSFLQYRDNFKKHYIETKAIIANNENILKYAPKVFKKFKYEYFNVEKPKKESGVHIPVVSDIIDKVEDYIPDKIKKIASELRAPLILSSLTGSFALSAIVFLGQRVNQQKFDETISNLYGIAGAVVSGIFLTPASAPAGFKITKSQAKFVLSGKLDSSDMISEKRIIQSKLKDIANSESEIDFDSISLIEV